jgi:hypothetical protein
MLIEVESYESPIPDFCCCDVLARALADDAAPVEYRPHHRSFGIGVLGTSAVDSISFCPFCGTALPPDLRGLWFEELDRLRLGPEAVPADSDLRSDRWWRAPRPGLAIPTN